MSKAEQRRIARNQGRLAAWLGQMHILPAFKKDPDMMACWQHGALFQCDRMSAAAAKIPLQFGDEMQRNKGD